MNEEVKKFWDKQEELHNQLNACAIFTIPKTSSEKLNIWRNEHTHKGTYTGAIGGSWTYVFTPTSLGTVMKVRCSICQNETDMTDYNDW